MKKIKRARPKARRHRYRIILNQTISDDSRRYSDSEASLPSERLCSALILPRLCSPGKRGNQESKTRIRTKGNYSPPESVQARASSAKCLHSILNRSNQSNIRCLLPLFLYLFFHQISQCFTHSRIPPTPEQSTLRVSSPVRSSDKMLFHSSIPCRHPAPWRTPDPRSASEPHHSHAPSARHCLISSLL